MGILLSATQRQELLGCHRKERDKRVADRIKAVLWRDEGLTCAEIAVRLFLSEEGVRQQVGDYLREERLAPDNGGSESKLTAAQTVELVAHLERNFSNATRNSGESCPKMTILYSWMGYIRHMPCASHAAGFARVCARKFLPMAARNGSIYWAHLTLKKWCSVRRNMTRLTPRVLSHFLCIF